MRPLSLAHEKTGHHHSTILSVDCFILLRTKVTNLYFSSFGVFSSFSLPSSLPCPPNLWRSYPTHALDCAIPTGASILCDFLDLVPSFLSVGSATISYFSTCKLFLRELITAFGFSIANPSHGTPHTFSKFLTQEVQFHLYPYLHGHITRSCTVVDPRRLLRRNNRVIILVSHPLMFSIVCWVHDQFSLPKANTAYTWSTRR